MVKYTHLNRDPGKAMEDLVHKLSASAKGQKTKPTGVKDMGDAGDIVWTRPDDPEFEVSIRDIDGDLQDAQGRIDEAKAESAEALVRAGEAEATAGAVRDNLDHLEAVTLPGAVADLEAADQAAQQKTQALDEKLYGIGGIGGDISKQTQDIQEAWNEAIAASEKATALIEAGESLLVNGGFERGSLGWGPHGNRTEIVETADAYAGTHVLRITPHEINTYPYADPVTAATGRTYRITYMVRHDGLDPNGRIRQYNMVRKTDGSQQGQFHPAWYTAGEFPANTWNKVTFDLTVTVPDATHIRFAPHFGISPNTYDIDEFRVVDITEAKAALDIAAAAKAAADSAQLAVNDTVTDYTVEYAVSTSDTVPPTTGWTAASATREPGEYVWMRTLVSYADATTNYTPPVLLTGNDGADGEQGAPGPKGDDGTSVTILGTKPTEADLPSAGNTAGDGYLIDGYLYVWDGSAWNNVGLIQGPQGLPGEPGSDGKPTYVWIKYADTDLGGGMSDSPVGKSYIGLAYNKAVQAESDVPGDYQWVLFEGPPGEPGAKGDPGEKGEQGDPGDIGPDGVSVTTITPFYTLVNDGAAAPPQPTTMTPTGWSASEPSWAEGTDLYRTERVVYSNGTFAYTTVSRVAAYEGIRVALDAANGKNKTWSSTTAPSLNGTAEGDLWYQVDSQNYTLATWIWDGNSWEPTKIRDEMLDTVTVNKLVGAKGDFVDFFAENFTANEGVVESLWTDQIVGKTATFNQINVAAGNLFIDPNGLNPALRTMVGGPGWTWNDTGKYWTKGYQATGTPQFETYSRTGTVYDSNLLTPGAMYLIAWDAWIDKVGVDTKARASIYYRRADGTTAFVGDQLEPGGDTSFYDPIPAAGQWTRIERYWRAPADVVSGGINFQFNSTPSDYAEVRVRNPLILKQGSAVSIEDGAITTPKLTVTEEMSAAIVNAMSVNTKDLIVTESAVLNHVTAIGQTVVDDINVQGKLIGTDGVFTGTVDFENVNVTGLQLVEKLEANSISADKIEGGAFTGESFTGGTFVGGEFRTSDTLPGQVTLADDAYINSTTGVAHPGIRVEPLDTSATVRPPGIGPGDLGLYVDGGSDTSGRSSFLRASPGGSLMRSLRGDGTTGGETFTSQESSLMRTYRADGIPGGEIYATPTSSIMRTYREGGTAGGEFSTSPTSSTMRTYREDGTNGGLIRTAPTESLMRTYSGDSLERGWVRVRPQDAELAYVAPDNTYFSQIKADASEAFLYTRAGGAGRYLSVDADGIWVKTNKSGSWKWYNLEDNASDSGWQSITPASGFAPIPEGFHVRQLGRMIYLRGAVTGNVTTGWVTIGTIPAGFRPTVRQINSGASSTITNLMFQTGTNGEIQVKGNNTGTGLNIFVNTILYPID